MYFCVAYWGLVGNGASIAAHAGFEYLRLQSHEFEWRISHTSLKLCIPWKNLFSYSTWTFVRSGIYHSGVDTFPKHEDGDYTLSQHAMLAIKEHEPLQ